MKAMNSRPFRARDRAVFTSIFRLAHTQTHTCVISQTHGDVNRTCLCQVVNIT